VQSCIPEGIAHAKVSPEDSHFQASIQAGDFLDIRASLSIGGLINVGIHAALPRLAPMAGSSF